VALSNELAMNGMDKCRQVIDRIMDELNVEDDGETGFDVRLLLTEAVSNAFIHGNGSDAGKTIKIRYSCFDGVARFEVEDTGEGFGSMTVPEELPDSKILEDCGRGLFLINCIADRVELKGNTIIIEKRIR
jgi:serine/threonine-protein kinase RsbW